MKFDTFKDLFSTLLREKENRDTFIKSVPSSIRDAFFDNEYIESYYVEVNALMSALFTDKILLDDIDYFLYEDMTPFVIVRGVDAERNYEIYTEEEMFSYFEKEYNWD